MNRDNDRQTSIILAVLGILPIVWLGLLIAPSVKGGLPEILPSLMNVMSDPFHIELCEDSVKTVLVLLLCYGMGIGIYFSIMTLGQLILTCFLNGTMKRTPSGHRAMYRETQ